MIKNVKWLLVFALMASCNNDKGNSSTHAEHMASSPANYCDSVNDGLITKDTMKGSPHRVAMNVINGNHVHIEYNSPGVKGRTIWGGLVPYDRVWATGAHMASNIQFSKDVQFDGHTVKAGKYAIFTIPGKNTWTFILNTRYDQHLSDDYDIKEDVLRMELKPDEHEMTQRLTYLVDKTGNASGSLQMLWEKVRISAPFTVVQ